MKKARDVRDQIVSLMNRVEIPLTSSPSDHIAIRKAILSGYFMNCAGTKGPGDAYRTLKHGQSVLIHPSSALFKENPSWVIYHELVLTKHEYMRQVLEIQPEWLIEAAPHYYKPSDLKQFSEKRPPNKS